MFDAWHSSSSTSTSTCVEVCVRACVCVWLTSLRRIPIKICATVWIPIGCWNGLAMISSRGGGMIGKNWLESSSIMSTKITAGPATAHRAECISKMEIWIVFDEFCPRSDCDNNNRGGPAQHRLHSAFSTIQKSTNKLEFSICTIYLSSSGWWCRGPFRRCCHPNDNKE